jgi:hypothetical protein
MTVASTERNVIPIFQESSTSSNSIPNH